MSEPTVKTYEIDGETYELRPLVLGQWKQLNRALDGIDYPEVPTVRNMTERFADRIDQFLAVVLTKQGTHPKDKDLTALAENFAWAMQPKQIAEVISDFFDLTPAASICNLVTGVMEKARLRMTAAIGSTEQLSTLPEETGPKKTPSSGDAPLRRPSPGSKNGDGTSSSAKP